MSVQARLPLPSFTRKRKRSAESFADQNEPIVRGHFEDRPIHSDVPVEGLVTKPEQPVRTLPRRALQDRSQNRDQASSGTQVSAQKGGDKVASGSKPRASAANSSFNIPVVRAEQKGQQPGPERRPDRARTDAGALFAIPSYDRGSGGVTRDSSSALRPPTAIASSSSGHARNRDRSASFVTYPTKETVSDEPPPLFQAKPQNRYQASTRTPASAKEAGGSRLVLGDKSDAGKTLSNARAAGQKGTGSVTGRSHAQKISGTPTTPSYQDRDDGGVPRGSDSAALRAPTPVHSFSTGLGRSRDRSASVASGPARKLVSDEQHPAILAKPQNRDQVSSRTFAFDKKGPAGGSRLVCGDTSRTDAKKASFNALPAAQRGPEPVQGQALPQTASCRQNGRIVPQGTRPPIAAASPAVNNTALGRNCDTLIAVATNWKMMAEQGLIVPPSPPHPLFHANSRNQDQASLGDLSSVRIGSAISKFDSRDKARVDEAKTTCRARATGLLPGVGTAEKELGSARARAREQTAARPIVGPTYDDVSARQVFRGNGLPTPDSSPPAVTVKGMRAKKRVISISAHISSEILLQHTSTVPARPQAQELFPLFTHLASVTCFFCLYFPNFFQYKVAYVEPPGSAPKVLWTTGFYYYLLIVVTKAAALPSYHSLILKDVTYEVFFFLALARWMSSQCDRPPYRMSGKHEHKFNSGSAVAIGPTGTPIPQTSAQVFVHMLVGRFREHKKRIVSPWILSYITKYIGKSNQLEEDERRLLSQAPIANLAYAAETLLSYKLTYPDDHFNPFVEGEFFSEKLHAVERTTSNEFELRQLFSMNKS